MGEGLLSSKQAPHPEKDVTVLDKEVFKIGMNASEVVESIFAIHGVEYFSYTKYNLASSYPMHSDQPLLWSGWSGMNEIQELSKKIYNDSAEEYTIEGLDIIVCEILGIGSKIRMREGVKQLRMLDFHFSEQEFNIRMIQDIGLPPGVILRTDQSYHYYGFDFIDKGDWRDWITKLQTIDKNKELFGWGYLGLCLDRGYSALRVYGYPGTGKEKTPVVVSII
ncbi:TPA: hypothetical protein DEP90_01375 [Patescibacteria group bacterium]|nr:hypothetical protein [Patescibacteria group bacterium]